MRTLPVKAMGWPQRLPAPHSPRSLQAAASQPVFLLLKMSVDQAPSPDPTESPLSGQEKLATLSEFSFSFVPSLEIRSEGSQPPELLPQVCSPGLSPRTPAGNLWLKQMPILL